jgi:sulfoxide reductase heme-binding subunit YedZ
LTLITKRLVWWLIFLTAASPSLVLFSLYLFNPRSLGVDPIEVILKEMGEWALRFLLLSLACSPIRRLGWKSIVRFRRMLGLFAFYYASLHLSTYLLGWIELDWQVFSEDIIKRPFIYLGMISWSLLAILALTSPKVMVRLLKKRWSMIHKLVYLIIVLVWVHLWLQSRASAGEAVFYGALALLFLGERIYRKASAYRAKAAR